MNYNGVVCPLSPPMLKANLHPCFNLLPLWAEEGNVLQVLQKSELK